MMLSLFENDGTLGFGPDIWGDYFTSTNTYVPTNQDLGQVTIDGRENPTFSLSNISPWILLAGGVLLIALIRR